MMGWWDQGSGWAYLVMSFGMIAFVALALWAVVTVGRGESRRPHSAGFGDADGTAGAGAARILDERFARGEIDADDYHSRLADLAHSLG